MIQESFIIWGSALAATTLIVAGYCAMIRRTSRHHRLRLAEAKRLGMNTPKGQFPYIDPEICIGCAGCINACPEGDVLGLVGGLATVVNGARCIGIGQCAKACPVGGIEIKTGSLRGRADVPLLDESRETDVPGVYVVGELGGLALIRNAVEQGRETVHAIADRAERAGCTSPRSSEVLDLAIVGAGPSGLSAALAAVETGLSYAVFEQEKGFGGTILQYPRRKLTHTQPVELPLYGTLKKSEYSREELLELFSALVAEFKLDLRFDHRVTGVTRRPDDSFEIEAGGTKHVAARVLLALGRRGTPRKLGVTGEQSSKVMYQVRDAEHYRNKKILCVGGGDSAIEAAMGLAVQPGNEVAISYRKEQFFRIKKKNEVRLEKLVGQRKLRLLMSSQVMEVDDRTVRLSCPDGELAIDNDYVFVMIGGVPPFGLLRDIGVSFGNDKLA